MAMANMNLIGVFVTKLWPVQALACGGGEDGGGDGGATKNIISPKFSNFGDIITCGKFIAYGCTSGCPLVTSQELVLGSISVQVWSCGNAFAIVSRMAPFLLQVFMDDGRG